MNNRFKMEKFTMNDSGTVLIRKHVYSNGKIIAFGIAGTDISTLDEEIDFDSQSNELIEKHKDTVDNLVFEFNPEGGFEQVSTNEQTWFSF